MLGAVVAGAAERFGERTAFVATDGWEVSYRDLDRLAHEAAVGLVARGVREGDVVALCLPPIPEYTVLYVAAARLGAITAGVNHRLAASEREAVLDRAGPRMVLSTEDLAPRSDHGAELVTVQRAARVDDVLVGLRAGGDLPALAPDPDRPVALIFTSGTTGLPKGAVFGGRQLDFITEVDTGHRWGGGSATYSGTSLAHLGPMTKLPGNLHRGGTNFLMEHWRAEDALRLVSEQRMAGIGGIPTQVALMLRHPDFDRYDLDCVQAIVIGGGPATPSLVREARARFEAALAVRYSCTEAGIGVGTAFDDPPEDAELTVGRAHPGVDLTIRDGEEVLPPGEEGQVCLRSPAVMTGYHQDPEATAEAFTEDGAVRTGDAGYLDDQGRLHLVGRTSEMYVRGGYNVFPTEVETVLVEHPGVADVAIAPRADDVMGEVGVAVVVPADPADPPALDGLRDFGAERLARHKLPEELLIRDSLPLTPMDKVDRRALRGVVETDK